MTRGKRTAFTLVELLVVITIIGMLTAMIFPAVNSAREAARKMQCSSNQHQVSTALLNYESHWGQFPGYMGRVGNSADSYMEASWVVMILPFIERNDLWQIWNRGWDNGNTSLLSNRCRFLHLDLPQRSARLANQHRYPIQLRRQRRALRSEELHRGYEPLGVWRVPR